MDNHRKVKFVYQQFTKEIEVIDHTELGQLQEKILAICNLWVYDIDGIYAHPLNYIGSINLSFSTLLNDIYSQIEYLEVIPRKRDTDGNVLFNPLIEPYLQYLTVKKDEELAREMEFELTESDEHVSNINLFRTLYRQVILHANNENNENNTTSSAEQQPFISFNIIAGTTGMPSQVETHHENIEGDTSESDDDTDEDDDIDNEIQHLPPPTIFNLITNILPENQNQHQHPISFNIAPYIPNPIRVENNQNNEMVETEMGETYRHLINDVRNILQQPTDLPAIFSQIVQNVHRHGQNFRPINLAELNDVKVVCSKEELANLSRIRYGDLPAQTTTNCHICLDDYDAGTEVILLECQHYFHEECIKTWLGNESHKCPLCKTDVGVGKIRN